ncbi:probable flap endonuclease 1 homolog isoform X1 [Takifugu flavidus]|uniref:probable flap endonuclease 1 homolog isoform X1 n=1 Tax=Takifugu flavidus TaxID=433684 RepID=UPI002543FFFA|nr:probable flap endonuclease 1 homolog isoform X1 [Takifugu flavidus]
MGITKLADLIRSDARDAVSYKDISDYTGKAIALDTSIVVNQFRAATPSLRIESPQLPPHSHCICMGPPVFLLSSPLIGVFFRALTFLEHDIKPVFVFDGRPPGEKRAVLEKRAESAGWRSPNRTGTASSSTRDCLQLLKLIGVPVIQAPGDAEALCAWLVKEGTVDAVASEDMDTLPFGASILIRQLNSKKDGEIIEYSLSKLLERLQINHQEFVDLCILLGCDYCEKICGLGPKRALTLIQKHRTIENVILHVNRKTHPVPLFWKYKEARKIFLDAPRTEPAELTWTEPDEEALVEFLCRTTHISEGRVRQRLTKFHQARESKREERAKQQSSEQCRQTRMEDFFRITRKRSGTTEAADSLRSNGKRPKPK